MSYVDAAYAICLSVLFLYGASVVARRRRLDRAEQRAGVSPVGAAPEPEPVTVTVDGVAPQPLYAAPGPGTSGPATPGPATPGPATPGPAAPDPAAR